MKRDLPGAWAPHVLSLELKKAFSYRLDFWITFVVGTAIDIGVSYFLWKAVFLAQNAQVMAGYSFHAIVFYYLFASFTMRITRGNDRGYISQEIYDGGLTRYLLYPVSFLGYKFVTHFAQQLLGILQFLIAFAFLFGIMGLPADQNISASSILAGLGTCLLAGLLHFMLTTCLELVAFWQDVIWNLMVMLRFIVMLLGGGMIPLAFFPAWGQKLVALTPFPALIAFPVKTFLGQITLAEWFSNIGTIGLWAAVFATIASIVWTRGVRQYSGVGI